MLRTRSGLPRHCTYQADRDGNRRVRFRRRSVSVYLTGIPWSEDFMRQYAAALEREQGQRAQIGASRTIPGSFSAACVSYYGSPDFLGLKESTRVGRRYVVEPFREKNGHRLVRDLRREHIRAILGQMQDRPHAANNLLKVLLVVLDHAVSQGMIASNPARGMRRYPTRNKDGYRAWSEEDIARFLATHPIGSPAGLAFALALYTGQRRGDLVKLGFQHLRGSRIELRQQKTGRTLSIPVHPELARALAAAPRTDLTFITGRRGRPLTPLGFGNLFAKMCREAGLSGLSVHGLRKACARRLAEAGCSANEIAAISGHASLREIAHYTAAAEQAHLADQALNRQLRAERERNLPNAATHVYPTAKKR
jgi:integrase